MFTDMSLKILVLSIWSYFYANAQNHYMTTCTSKENYCDSSLTAEARAKNLVSLLTVEEKMQQISTNSYTSSFNGITPGIPRLGVLEILILAYP